MPIHPSWLGSLPPKNCWSMWRSWSGAFPRRKPDMSDANRRVAFELADIAAHRLMDRSRKAAYSGHHAGDL